MHILKPEIVKQAKKEDDLIILLKKANKKSFRTVQNWFNEPVSEKLIGLNNLDIIAKYLELKVSDIIEIVPELINK